MYRIMSLDISRHNIYIVTVIDDVVFDVTICIYYIL